MVKKLISFFENLFDGLGMIGGFIIAFATALAAINAILRYFVAGIAGIVWAEELCTLLCIIAVFISCPWIESSNQHLKIGILEGIVKNESVKKVIHILRGILTICMYSLLIYAGTVTIITSYELKTVTYVLGWPRYIIYLILVGSCVLVNVGWIVIITLNKGGRLKCRD